MSFEQVKALCLLLNSPQHGSPTHNQTRPSVEQTSHLRSPLGNDHDSPAKLNGRASTQGSPRKPLLSPGRTLQSSFKHRRLMNAPLIRISDLKPNYNHQLSSPASEARLTRAQYSASLSSSRRNIHRSLGQLSKVQFVQSETDTLSQDRQVGPAMDVHPVISKEEFAERGKGINLHLKTPQSLRPSTDLRQRQLEKIMKAAEGPESLQSPQSSRKEVAFQFVDRVRRENATLLVHNKQSWVSPLSTYRRTLANKHVPPSKIPDLTLDTAKPYQTSKGKLQVAKLQNQQSTPPTQPIQTTQALTKPVHRRGKSDPKGVFFRTDESSFVKYMFEFVNIVKVSNELKKEMKEKPQPIEDLQDRTSSLLLQKNSTDIPTDTFTDLSALQTFVKTETVLLFVLKQQYQYIFKGREQVGERILRALQIDEESDSSEISWEHYLIFMKVLVHYEAPRPELTNFVLRFLVGRSQYLKSSKVKKLFKLLAQGYEQDSAKHVIAVKYFEQLCKDWEYLGIISSTSKYLHTECFKSIYNSNKLSVYSLLNRITNRV